MFLEFENLSIRKAEINDAPLLGNWWRDGQVMAHAGFPNGLDISNEQIAKDLTNGWSNGGLLIMQVDGTAVGEMSFRDKGDKVASIGIKICNKDMQGKGYGTKFLKMLIKYLFEHKGFEKIILDTNVKNIAAQKTYEGLGFVKVAVHEDSWTDQLGQLQSYIDYEMTKADWELQDNRS